MTRSGLWFRASCRHCTGPDPQPLVEVNPGHTDGCRATWVGRCENCGRQFVITASIAQVQGRGVPGHAR